LMFCTAMEQLILLQVLCALLHRICGSTVPVQYLFSNKCTILHASPQELLHGYSETGVAYLDLSYYPTDALPDPGPAACVAGKLELVPGQFGMPSQVCHSDITEQSLSKLNIMSTTGNLWLRACLIPSTVPACLVPLNELLGRAPTWLRLTMCRWCSQSQA
jgi:hypothetical protein